MSADKPPTPVKVETVQAYSAPGGARYSASIIPGSQVELSFRLGGYLDKIMQVGVNPTLLSPAAK